DDICKELNVNKCYFCSVFKKEVGSTFINYLNNYKIEKSKELLKNPNISLLDVSLSVGYNNQSYFSTVFKKITSKTPLEFRDEYLKNKN
ncbi:MAG: helix-turn-helix transcriptional regulator, partial [Clostridium celatum]|nr:helix-turn-helix transcriptional regulator [Clostridium celatum]